MPNWVTNTITFTGDENTVKDLMKQIKDCIDKGERIMNHFFPMPETYTKYDTTNYRSSDFVVGEKTWARTVLRNNGGEAPTIITQEFIQEWREAEEEQRKIGPVGWYEWRCQNYGCKWDMCNPEIFGDDALICDTPWSEPQEFYTRLSILYPNIVIHTKAEYECDNYIYFTEYENGDVIYADIKEIDWDNNEE